MNKKLILLFPLLFGVSLIIYGIYPSYLGYFAYKEDVEAEIQNESVQPESSPMSVETVHEEIKETIFNETLELKCPDSCDDKNPCTSEGCSKNTNYTCEYIAVPCCGNKICDSGESCSSCSLDCGICQTEPVQQTITTTNETITQNETQNYTQQTLNHIIITEFITHGSGGAADEFVEIYNPTSTAVDIGGWKLQYKSATGPTWNSKVGDGFPDGSIIKPSGYFLLASKNYSLSVTPDYRHTATWGFSDSGGHIRIINKDGNTIDKVGYGENANDPEGSVISDISVLPLGGSLERKKESGNYIDTDNNSNDFISNAIPNPQKST